MFGWKNVPAWPSDLRARFLASKKVPPSPNHLDQARRNLDMLRYLVDNAEQIGPGAAEWAVTVAFYAALHVVEAYLSGRGSAVQRTQGSGQETGAGQGARRDCGLLQAAAILE